MKVLVVEPFKSPYAKEIDGTLESMQNVVKGLIQPVFMADEGVIVVNEEGKMKGLIPNRMIVVDGYRDLLCGTFFVCLAPEDSEEFEGLSDEQIQKYSDVFNRIEIVI